MLEWLKSCVVRVNHVRFLTSYFTQNLSVQCTSITSSTSVPSRTLWTISWLAKTSNKPISLTTWLVVNANFVNYNIPELNIPVLTLWWRIDVAKEKIPGSNSANSRLVPINVNNC